MALWFSSPSCTDCARVSWTRNNRARIVIKPPSMAWLFRHIFLLVWWLLLFSLFLCVSLHFGVPSYFDGRNAGLWQREQCLRLCPDVLWIGQLHWYSPGWYVGSCHSMIRLEIVTQTVVVHDLFYWLRRLGHLYGTYGDYHGTFYFAGSVVFIAGAICYPLACVNRKPSEGTQKSTTIHFYYVST